MLASKAQTMSSSSKYAPCLAWWLAQKWEFSEHLLNDWLTVEWMRAQFKGSAPREALDKPDFPLFFLSKREEPNGILNHPCMVSTLMSETENWVNLMATGMKKLRLYKISDKQKFKNTALDGAEMYLQPTASAFTAAGAKAAGTLRREQLVLPGQGGGGGRVR